LKICPRTTQNGREKNWPDYSNGSFIEFVGM
jgi:hypothetical protein